MCCVVYLLALFVIFLYTLLHVYILYTHAWYYFATFAGCKYMNDECVALIAPRYGLHLTTLLLGGCEDITDASLLMVAQHCRNVEQIDLSCCEVTDAGLTALVHSCRSLNTILLKKCVNVTDASVLVLSQLLPDLVKLDLNGCKRITDTTLSALSVNNPLLRELDVTNCDVVTKPAVKAIIASIPELSCQNFWQYYL